MHMNLDVYMCVHIHNYILLERKYIYRCINKCMSQFTRLEVDVNYVKIRKKIKTKTINVLCLYIYIM
jgi:hypothetical protein